MTGRRREMIRQIGTACIAAAILAASPVSAQDSESATAALFDRIAGQPARLRLFLQAMPKGGDLHNHLWGTPYAEDFLGWAAEDGLCVARERPAIVAPPCVDPDRPAARGLGVRDPALYSATIDALSTRGRDQGLGVNDRNGHDDFFDSFAGFAQVAVKSGGRMLAVARESAAANRLSYLELMQNPDAVGRFATRATGGTFDPEDFAGDLRRIADGIPAATTDASTQTDRMEHDARQVLRCGTASAGAACSVEVRYQLFAMRSQPPAFVFGQLAIAFALAERDPRFVGINILAPEDGAVALADYGLHMRMFRFFAARHPGVKLSLHAGELALGLVPPAALRSHIRDAVEIAGADRIGHGVDIPYETDAPALLARMARDRIAVEINLSSNAMILGISGASHPLSLYRAAGVPIVLSTDDEGVARSDMTNEYLRAATEQGLRYRDLKQIARASIEYAFLAGASLWQAGAIGTRADACAAIAPGTPAPGGACGRLLAASDKARVQWRLETEFRDFESRIGTLPF